MADTDQSDSETKDGSSIPMQITYVRPADRTPEKDFHLLNEEEKKIVCYRRSMIGKVRDKLSRLEDEVDERDKTIKTERQLRVEAEDRLQGYLRDMYNNGQVNQELRDRLPRANKSDPFKREDVTETECSSIEEEIEAQSESQSLSKPVMKSTDMKGLESQIITDHKDNGATSSPKSSSPRSTSPRTARRSLDFSTSNKTPTTRESKSESTGAQSEQSAPRFPYTGLATPHTGMFSPAFGASPYLPFSGSLLHNPLLHSYPQSSLYRPMSAPLLQHTNFMNGPGSGTAPEPSLNHSFTTPTTESVITSTQSQTVSATEPLLGATGGQSSASPMPRSYPSSVAGSKVKSSLLPDPLILPVHSRLPVSGASYGADHSGHVASLLAEIDSQRADTRRLREQLEQKDRELEAMRLSLKASNLEKRLDVSDAEKAAGLVHEVYSAQRKRDEATNNRITLANQERDDIVARLREVELRLEEQNSRQYAGADSSEEDLQLEEETLENEDIHYLMSQLDAGTSPDRESAVSMVRRLEMMRQRQREVTNEEMQIVMEQRDVALAKCRKLEAELLRYQKQSEADGGMDKNMKAKLAALQQERDLAVAKSKQLDDEIQTIRIYYSLHKSLSNETLLLHQSQPTNNAADTTTRQHVNTHPEHVDTMHQQLEHLQKENENLGSRLHAATIDKQQLQRALDTVTQDKERLQRLARVLQRKLNSFNETPEEEKH